MPSLTFIALFVKWIGRRFHNQDREEFLFFSLLTISILMGLFSKEKKNLYTIENPLELLLSKIYIYI